ncbi:5-methylcytosine-specific restriction enzyme B [Actinobacillus indolicus]|nr:5-methylcytosine-specific restriction enzyme B [Actinobacillus indolicus]VTU08939.1 5-methylcytosine-specific restriction enzyme B [Actinobacillus indolicus]
MIHIYLRIVDSQAYDKQISITKYIMENFFGFLNNHDEITITGEASSYSDKVLCLTSTDSRLGGKIKDIINKEGGMNIGDILLFKKQNNKITISIIKQNDYNECNILTSLLPNNTNKHVLISSDNDILNDDNMKNDQVNSQKESLAKNLLLYGVAGIGKSYYIKHSLGIDENFSERVVFHPDYLNADFIGQILPTVEKDDKGTSLVTYQFKAGPFTKILKRAIKDSNNHYYLIIEEINRGNAPAIFGEVFQLLDRDSNGCSTYKISHELIANEVYGNPNEKVYLPNNLSIVATMNSADQNVFTLDTAFQRRWTMRMIENNIKKCDFKDSYILDTNVTWGVFNSVINEHILIANKDTMASEDKRLGAFFIKAEELQENDGYIPFAEKVIKYLWDDVFRFNKNKLFDGKFNSLDEVITQFEKSNKDARFNIFQTTIKDTLINKSMEKSDDGQLVLDEKNNDNI